MVRESQLARRLDPEEASALPYDAPPQIAAGICPHRTVANDGRIVCNKIVEGDNEVSPNVCRDCPSRAADCAHLRFSLRQRAPSPLIVRHNGRTEIWDDGPPELQFERAACAARTMPIHDPRVCATCALRQPLRKAAGGRAGKVMPLPVGSPARVEPLAVREAVG